VVSFSAPADPREKWPHTSGRPFRGVQVQIRDPQTRLAIQNPDERGEIWVRGYSVFDGYHKSPERNAEVFDSDGWFFTGDHGSLDADGRLSYLGRSKDMLKVGGENVAALEIEGFLQTHPAVHIAAVVGLPDSKYAEVPAAFCELKEGLRVTEAELIEYCRGQIAGFKIPRHIRFVRPDEWPMSATKIQKAPLAEKLRAELGL